jgi:hypothetical protein
MEVKPGYKQTEVGVIPDECRVFCFEVIFFGADRGKRRDGNEGTP